MGRIARGFDRDVAPIDPGGQLTVGLELVEHAVEQRCILGVKGHRQRL